MNKQQLKSKCLFRPALAQQQKRQTHPISFSRTRKVSDYNPSLLKRPLPKDPPSKRDPGLLRHPTPTLSMHAPSDIAYKQARGITAPNCQNRRGRAERGNERRHGNLIQTAIYGLKISRFLRCVDDGDDSLGWCLCGRTKVVCLQVC